MCDGDVPWEEWGMFGCLDTLSDCLLKIPDCLDFFDKYERLTSD